jgi:large subunit ribosomal protein L4
VFAVSGEVAGSVDLNPVMFASPELKSGVVHQVVTALQASSRNTVASSKKRGDVRGGGKKPWQQKGTGRARAGSIRSPLWRGGGITFGPSAERNFKKSVNKQTRRQALFASLTDRTRSGNVFVIEKFAITEPKTKSAKLMLDQLRSKIKGLQRKLLLITAEKNNDLLRSVRNLPDTELRTANSLNVLDILKAGSILVEKDALMVMEKTYLRRE